MIREKNKINKGMLVNLIYNTRPLILCVSVFAEHIKSHRSEEQAVLERVQDPSQAFRSCRLLCRGQLT